MTVPLPHTWRPRLARVVGFCLAAMAFIGGIALALLLPDTSGADYHAADRVGVAVIGTLIAGALLVLIRPALRADADGLEVVNFLSRRRLAWAEVVGIDLAATQSWAAFDLSDGTSLPVVALQTADGKRFRRAIEELQDLLAQHATDSA